MPGLQPSRKRSSTVTYSASKTPVQVQPAQAFCVRSEIYSAFHIRFRKIPQRQNELCQNLLR